MLREIRIRSTIYVSIVLILCVFIGGGVSGCKPSSPNSKTNTVQHDGHKLSVKLALPMALTGLPVSNLSAKVSIDGHSSTALTVNADNTVSGEIANVKAGPHQLIITYFVLEAGLPVNLAVAIKDINIIANGTTRVDISESDLNRNIDDDRDGYTNLAEIRIGTRALDKFDSPGGESPLYVVSNGSFGQSTSNSYVIKHTLGASVGGASQSTNYRIVSGFYDN
ncbi:MAG: hypothetical protein L3J88_08615 [Gammaproteobacteria bacterium]|nr:hypothetical protein [Gammaproteobacteria bacterium]MCF6363390.1 hypothetical protein [Gammaproteobacteria bacterium]